MLVIKDLCGQRWRLYFEIDVPRCNPRWAFGVDLSACNTMYFDADLVAHFGPATLVLQVSRRSSRGGEDA